MMSRTVVDLQYRVAGRGLPVTVVIWGGVVVGMDQGEVLDAG
jgi:hypothetical protein